jgi:hypothetical protein
VLLFQGPVAMPVVARAELGRGNPHSACPSSDPRRRAYGERRRSDALFVRHDRRAERGRTHTQANLFNAVNAIATGWQFTPDDVLANVLPLFIFTGCRLRRTCTCSPEAE